MGLWPFKKINMNLDLKNKTAVVCGSTQGIGKAIAIELAELGCNIILVARNEESLKSALLDLATNNQQKHSYLLTDYSIPTEINSLANHLKDNCKVDILINNSGGPSAGEIINESPDKFLMVFNQHLLANQALAMAVFPNMKANGFGRIVNVISTSVKQPLKNLGVSNTIRAAVAAWAKTWSYEVAKYGITVNNVLPGATATNRLKTLLAIKATNTNNEVAKLEAEMIAEIPAARFGQAHEIAALAAFLCSPAAAYINGTSIPVDGGRSTAI
jgi:3-oxoacyl-[acyl-carrier protein] reductase